MTSASSMHEAGHSKSVFWANLEGWGREGGGMFWANLEGEGGEHRYTHG